MRRESVLTSHYLCVVLCITNGILIYRDIAPEGANLDETNRNLDELVTLAKDLMEKNNIKLLWNTCNLFHHPR